MTGEYNLIEPTPFELTMSLDYAIPNETWQPAGEFLITPEANQHFMDCLDDHQPWYRDASSYEGPIAAPGVLHELAFCAMMHRFPVAPPEGQASMHAKQDSDLYHPARVGTKVKIEVRLIDKYVRRNKDYIVHEARILDESGRLLLTSRWYRMVGRRE